MRKDSQRKQVLKTVKCEPTFSWVFCILSVPLQPFVFTLNSSEFRCSIELHTGLHTKSDKKKIEYWTSIEINREKKTVGTHIMIIRYYIRAPRADGCFVPVFIRIFRFQWCNFPFINGSNPFMCCCRGGSGGDQFFSFSFETFFSLNTNYGRLSASYLTAAKPQVEWI